MAQGSGAGSEITALAESLQAYACAARQYYGKDLQSVADITPESVKGVAFCDRKLETCINKLGKNWYHSVVVTANLILKELPKGSGKYRFYRGVGLPDVIYSEFHELKKGSGLTGSDKWNPADIWMAKESFNYKGDFATLQDLNRYLYDNFMNGNMYGISLKVVPRGLPHSRVYNDGKPLVAEFSGIKLGKNMFDSKDIYIQYTSEGKKGEIQLRNFSSRPVTSSWQGEIKGNTAAGGKIGGGILVEYANEEGSAVAKPSAFTNQITNPSDATIKNFAKMFKELSDTNETLQELERQTKIYAKQDNVWWMSKYLSVYFVYTLMKKKKIDEVTKKAFEYGSSATKNSSIFIKYYQ
jgi:hypothetical protein